MKRIIFSVLCLQCAFVNAQYYAWAKAMTGGFSEGNFITVDATGNVYTTGNFNDTVDFDPGVSVANLISNGSDDIFISKLDVNGNYVWAKSIGGGKHDESACIAVDESGNVYVTGSFRDTVDFDPGIGLIPLVAHNLDIFILKLDASGNFVWAKRIGGNFADGGEGIKLDRVGNIYSTGYFAGIVDFDPGAGISNLGITNGQGTFVSKLDSTGNFIWAKYMKPQTIGYSGSYGYAIALDALGNIYTSGQFGGTVDFDPGIGIANLTGHGNWDIFVSKLDSAGNYVWAKGMGGVGSEGGAAIAIDASGNVYTTGYFGDTVDFDPGSNTANILASGYEDAFISKLDASGNYVWVKSIGATTGLTNGTGIVIDTANNIYTIGRFDVTADFNPDTGIAYLYSNGPHQIFISKLDSSGHYIWAKDIGSVGHDEGFSITIDGAGNLYSTGLFNFTVDFNPGTDTAYLTADTLRSNIFVLKLAPFNIGVSVSSSIDASILIKIYPNPTTGCLAIISEQTIQTLTIYNLLGEQLLQQNIEAKNAELNIAALPSGVYLLKVKGKDWEKTQRIVKE